VRFVEQAVHYEARRQIEVIEGGGKIAQETRLFDTKNGTTRALRSKEDAHDYRYFPDPDLMPLTFEQSFVDGIRKKMPELPDAKKARFIKDYSLSVQDASVLVAERDRAEFFETVAKGRDAKLASNWLLTELLGALNRAEKELKDSPVNAEQLGALVGLISDSTISGRIAKDVFAEMFATGKDAAKIVDEKGLKQVTDTGAIEKVIDEVLKENEGQIAEYKAGKDKVFGFFVGQIMKKSGGKANPAMVNEILKAKLAKY
jgi:aspartyl-tRNA(Asn)/glutamyl-tRNA(Gln) amidotransferase subunit B